MYCWQKSSLKLWSIQYIWCLLHDNYWLKWDNFVFNNTTYGLIFTFLKNCLHCTKSESAIWIQRFYFCGDIMFSQLINLECLLVRLQPCLSAKQEQITTQFYFIHKDTGGHRTSQGWEVMKLKKNWIYIFS